MKDTDTQTDETPPDFSALSAALAPLPLRLVASEHAAEVLRSPDFSRNSAPIQVVLASPQSGSARLRRFWRLLRLKQNISASGSSCSLLGLQGDPAQPTLLLRLTHQVLYYAYAVTFRCADSPMRSALKIMQTFLPGSLLWSGPLLLIIHPQSGCATATSKALSANFDLLTLFSAERQVSFLFRSAEKWPFAVRKAGEFTDLTQEFNNHQQAVALLGVRVPAVYADVAAGPPASFALEYIPEYTLVNRVAESWSGRERTFIREALGHLDFCAEIYRQFVARAVTEKVAVTAVSVDSLLANLAELQTNEQNATFLATTLAETIGTELTWIMQHGDFCVRNILIAGGERGRVLIDWEDFQEKRWPLADYVLLRLSLKEVYADLFNTELTAMENIPELANGLIALETELMSLLSLDQESFRAAELLSLACLCRQNVRKGRSQTATSILRELLQRLPTEPAPHVEEGTA